MYRIVEKTKIWFAISLIIIIIGLGFMFTKGFVYGIDFVGGTTIRINMDKTFDKTAVDNEIKKYAPDEESTVIDNTIIEIRSTKLNSSDKVSALFADLKSKYSLKEANPVSQDTVGASLGQEIRNKAILAIVIANFLILLYVAFRFEFKFGVSAIVALVHDVLITLSVYAIFRITLDSGFIAAMLTVIGYSMSDTIVVFDRIRENQKFMRKSEVVELADASITQTFRRSIFTVLTVLITLTSVFYFVPDARNFSEPLLIGIISGCYSSIFIATPFWVILKKHTGKKAATAKK